MTIVAQKNRPSSSHKIVFFVVTGQRVSYAERTVSDEALKTAVNDIFAHIEQSEKQQEDKSENKEKEEHQANKEELRTPVEEPIITPEEVPLLGDLGTAKFSGKGLLDVRVIFVIGKLAYFVFLKENRVR